MSPFSIKRILAAYQPLGWFNLTLTLPRPVRHCALMRIAGFVQSPLPIGRAYDNLSLETVLVSKVLYLIFKVLQIILRNPTHSNRQDRR